MIPLANTGAFWKETKGVAVPAARILIVDEGDGTWVFRGAGEAASLGGAAAVWEEESSDVFALTPIGASISETRRLAMARLHTNPALSVVADTDGTWLLVAPVEATLRGAAVAVFEETAARSGTYQLIAIDDVTAGRARTAPVAVAQTITFF